METSQNKNTAIIVAMVLNVLNLILNVYGLICRDVKIYFLISIINGVAILYYALIGYKKPHGDLLKYIMVIFAINVACYALTNYVENVYISYCYVFAALLIAYACGRLDRDLQNKYILLIVFIIFVFGKITASAFVKEEFTLLSLTRYSEIIEWFAIMVTYLTRYEKHREIGNK